MCTNSSRRRYFFKNGRYEVNLPWKEATPTLPSHYELSLKRLTGLLRCLRQSPDILRRYDDVIKEQLAAGIVDVVKDEGSQSKLTHYLLHHPVIREDKLTTKVRVVYDASAKTRGPSLNDCLYAGPKFDQCILDILLRFRSHKVALVADIEKAFLQISVAPCDRDVLRFLWIDDVQQEGTSSLDTKVCPSCLWSVVKPIPFECHHQTSCREIQGYRTIIC